MLRYPEIFPLAGLDVKQWGFGWSPHEVGDRIDAL